MSYCAKLTGEDSSHHLNKIESVVLKNLVLASESDIKLAHLPHSDYIFLPDIMAARTAGIDRNKKLRHCHSMY